MCLNNPYCNFCSSKCRYFWIKYHRRCISLHTCKAEEYLSGTDGWRALEIKGFWNVRHLWRRASGCLQVIPWHGVPAPGELKQSMRMGKWGGWCQSGNFVYLRTLCACSAAVMIMGVMIVVIHRVIVLNPLSVSITAVCGSKSSHKLYSPPDSLITIKRKSIHIRQVLFVSLLSKQSMTERGG